MSDPIIDLETSESVPVKRKRGRPTKREVREKRPVGRPPGQRAAQLEMQEQLYANPKSKRLVEKILDAALDDENKNQAAAWKLCMDRLVPVSGFEKLTGRNNIQINISGVGEPTVVGETIEQENVIEAD